MTVIEEQFMKSAINYFASQRSQRNSSDFIELTQVNANGEPGEKMVINKNYIIRIFPANSGNNTANSYILMTDYCIKVIESYDEVKSFLNK